MKTDYRTITVDIVEGVAVFTIHNPPVNQMSPQLSQDLSEAVREAYEDADVKAVVLTGTGKNFVAGADITQLKRVKFNMPLRGPGFSTALKPAPSRSLRPLTATAWVWDWRWPWPAITGLQQRGSISGNPRYRSGSYPGPGVPKDFLGSSVFPMRST